MIIISFLKKYKPTRQQNTFRIKQKILNNISIFSNFMATIRLACNNTQGNTKNVKNMCVKHSTASINLTPKIKGIIILENE